MLPPVVDVGGLEEVIHEFVEWCSGNASRETCRRYAAYILQRCSDTTNRWCAKAWKKFLRFLCEKKLLWEACLGYMEIRIPKSGVDIYVPSDEEVFKALSDTRYGWVYRLLVESGLRLIEIEMIDPTRCVKVDGFYRCAIGARRGYKQVLWAYLLEKPPKPVRGLARRVSAYAHKRGLVAPKYIRKWVATKMLALGIPGEVINFVQGRVGRNVLEKHYLELLTLADKWYKVYAQWLRNQGLV